MSKTIKLYFIKDGKEIKELKHKEFDALIDNNNFTAEDLLLTIEDKGDGNIVWGFRTSGNDNNEFVFFDKEIQTIVQIREKLKKTLAAHSL